MSPLPIRSEHGFTLVELLVTMTAGLVVLGTLFAILDVTMHQTTRTFSRVDATQRTRPAMETIENELHSACVADGVAPIQAGSTASNLIFVSQFGNSASPTPVWHELTFASTAGTLTDNTYTTAGTAPDWTRGTPVASTLVLDNVKQATFQYFAYQQAATTDAAGNAYEILPDGNNPVPGTSTAPFSPLSTSPSLTGTDAQNAAEVLITLVVGPGGGSNENTNLSGVNQTVQDGVVLRLTPAPNHVGAGASFSPCA